MYKILVKRTSGLKGHAEFVLHEVYLLKQILWSEVYYR